MVHNARESYDGVSDCLNRQDYWLVPVTCLSVCNLILDDASRNRPDGNRPTFPTIVYSSTTYSNSSARTRCMEVCQLVNCIKYSK